MRTCWQAAHLPWSTRLQDAICNLHRHLHDPNRCTAGYLVLDDFASADEVAQLKARAEKIIEHFDASSPSVFSTVNQASISMTYKHAHDVDA